MKKAVLTETVAQLPDEFSLDELIQRLILLDKIEKSRQQVREGKTHTTEDARRRFEVFLS